MHGIIPPSIVNYDCTVKINDPSYLNVSFPFRVRIEKIWFTTQRIYGATDGFYEGVADAQDTLRELKLAAVKTKNTRTQWDAHDNPTEYSYVFSPFIYDEGPDESLKPTLWLGDPDNADGNLGAFATGSSAGGDYVLNQRSTAKTALATNTFYNSEWSSSEYNAQRYDADVAVMNTDEFLQLFIYNSAGDWTDYANDGKVTISVAYTGMWDEDAVSDTVKPFDEWWNWQYCRMAMKTVWFWKGPRLSEKWVLIANNATNEHPHTFMVESDECPTNSEKLSYCSLDYDENLLVTLNTDNSPELPSIWYIVEETSSPIDMIAVHAIAGYTYPDGTVVRVKDVKGIELRASDRLGFIRWFRKDSRLQQIFVADAWRRKGLSTILFRIADIIVLAGEYGPYLNGGDITTGDGEKLREAWSNSNRVAPRIGSVE